MKKILLISILCSMAAHGSLSTDSNIKFGVGPSWNQIIAIEHFTIKSDNKKARTIIAGLDNPGAVIAANYRTNPWDKFYLELGVYDILGNRGSLKLNRAEQESPFTVTSDLNGFLSTNVFETILIGGKDWQVFDSVKFTLGVGYNYVLANRKIKFPSDSFRINIKDQFNAFLLKSGFTINPTSKTAFSFLYFFSIGQLNIKLSTFCPKDTTHYKFKQFMNNIIVIDGTYKINDRCSASLSATWFIAQNINNGQVKQSPADAALFKDRFASLYRSQFYFMIFSLAYDF